MQENPSVIKKHTKYMDVMYSTFVKVNLLLSTTEIESSVSENRCSKFKKKMIALHNMSV